MDVKELIIKAIKVEASIKPDETIIVGDKVMTYKQFAELIENIDEIDPELRKQIYDFLKMAIKLFKQCEEFRKSILTLISN